MTADLYSYIHDSSSGGDLYREDSGHTTLAVTKLGQDLFEQLKKYDDIWNECLIPDWDGYGAKPLSIGDLTDMKLFLRQIPSNIVFPEMIPEPDGTISIEWGKSAENYIIVSFDGSGKYEWVARRSNEKRKGQQTPIHEAIKGELKDLLELIGAKDIQ